MNELRYENKVKGVGGYADLIAKFPAEIKIDDDTHFTDCYIISKEFIDDEMIVGLDII